MSPDLEDRLRNLQVAAPEDLKSRAMHAAEADPGTPGRRPPWLEVMGAVAVVLLLVVVVLNVTAAPAHNLFSNISAGLGT